MHIPGGETSFPEPFPDFPKARDSLVERVIRENESEKREYQARRHALAVLAGAFIGRVLEYGPVDHEGIAGCAMQSLRAIERELQQDHDAPA